MRGMTVLVALLLFTACEKKTEIKPLFHKKKLTEIHGDGKVMSIKVKVPLSQDMVGSYDASEILEDESLDQEKQNLVRRVWNGIKYKVMDAAVNFGISNRIKYSFDYELPEIDSKYIKSLKVNKVFFALENCPESDEECRLREKERPVTFKFLDQLFLNASIVLPGETLSLEEEDVIIGKKEFTIASEKAFAAKPKNFFSYVNERGEIDNSIFRDVNLATFMNSRSYRNDEEVANDLAKVFLLRLRADLSKSDKIELVRQFRSRSFNGVISDFSLIGNNVYLELRDPNLKEHFFDILRAEAGTVENLGIDSFEGCTQANCANLKANNSNLVPMLEKSNHIRFDTYLALKQIEKRDFRYNGFVELELKLDFGI